MESSDKFCLRWNDFDTNISVAFRELREEKDFFDVTLACDDDSQIQAHRVILSACSPFFRNVLRRNPHQHPLLYLKGVKYRELLSVLNFMYMGEVNVAQEELNSFLSVAEDLRVKGLTQNKPLSAESKVSQTSQDKPKQVQRQPDPAPPPPKRPRVVTSTPGVAKKPLPTPGYSQVDDEIQEYIPVKTEPREPPPQPISLQPVPAPFHTQDDYQPQSQEQEIVQDGEHDQRTVALDEGYAVDEGYEYQYGGEGYGDQNTTTKDDVNKDLESVIFSKMSKNSNGEWQCNDCFKTSKVKTNIYVHIEANHVESPGYQCDVCYKVCTTSNALRKHHFVKHRQENYNYQ